MGQAAIMGKNRIMIYGPKNDGTYVVEFRTAAGETLAISRASAAGGRTIARVKTTEAGRRVLANFGGHTRLEEGRSDSGHFIDRMRK